MAEYNSNLKTWGSAGSEYPNGYAYAAGEQPVDAWDNFLTSNIIEDLNHLIALTNDRLESDSATTYPNSPEQGHLAHRSDSETLNIYDSTASKWRELFFADGSRPMRGSLNMGNYGITGFGDLTDKNGNKVYDVSAGHVPQNIVQQGGGSGLDADTLDGNHASAFAASGHVHDGRYYTKTNADSTFTTLSEVNNNADVPNADHADSAGDADTLDGNHAGAFASSDHNHDGRYYTESQTRNWVNNNADVPNSDYADSAGDADTVDGKHASELGRTNAEVDERVIAYDFILN